MPGMTCRRVTTAKRGPGLAVINRAIDVRFWHLADMPIALHMSAYDPKRTWPTAQRTTKTVPAWRSNMLP